MDRTGRHRGVCSLAPLPFKQRDMKPERIEEIVANYYNTDIRLIKGQDQKAEYPEPRSFIYFFLHMFCGLNTVEIGERFNRQPQFVTNGIRNMDMYKMMPEKRFKFNQIQKQILNEKLY